MRRVVGRENSYHRSDRLRSSFLEGPLLRSLVIVVRIRYMTS